MSLITTYTPYIPLILFAGFLLNALFGSRFFSRQAVTAAGVGSSLTAFALVITVFVGFLSRHDHSPVIIPLFTWIQAGTFTVNAALRIDALSLVMMLVVTGVGTIIHLFSVGYMAGDKGYARFFAYMNLFMFSMLVLVMADNVMLMFLGWEGVGLCSYLLIGYYYDKEYAAKAANKAFIVNRIGDAGFILGMFFLFSVFGTFDFEAIKNALAAAPIARELATVITLLLFVGAVGKSAQLPLSIWLPDAMAGPTPVSALIHAATMVTAGVYLIARLNFLFVLSPFTMTVIAIIGALTALAAATVAVKQTDIKKVLAYSTISQLGIMFTAMGVGAFSAGIGHLITHAFFKALLFLAAGSVIHMLHHEQDIRKMGGLKKFMPLTFAAFFIGTFTLAGAPFCSGFFSKDEIIFLSLTATQGHWAFTAVLLLTSGLTSFYIFRVLFAVFFGAPRDGGHNTAVKEAPAVMWLPLMILTVGAITAGYLMLPKMFGQNVLDTFLHSVLPQSTLQPRFEDSESLFGLSGLMALLSFTAFLIGCYAAYRRYIVRAAVPFGIEKAKGFAGLLVHAYHFDAFLNAVVVIPLMGIGAVCKNVFDGTVFYGFSQLTAATYISFSKKMRRLQTGVLTDYTLAFTASIVVLVAAVLIVVMNTAR
ncbi:MAG: NADH-quinone oxidoreductase subunit L [Spirochaetes bacterium]|nr:NADH-quinone oxidoreductase subunit L [Spirochaetota bacterium]